jgi:hypothetical protein
MTNQVGGISAVKTKVLSLIAAADSSLTPEATHVLPNWRTDISYLETSYPVVTIRIGTEDVSERIYGRQISSTIRGHFAVYTFSAHVWDENAATGPKSADACALADKIINYLCKYTGDNVSGICSFINLSGRESEPERGPQRLSRVIIEGFIEVKRVLS